jgi:VWFA-related protein
MRRTLLAVCVMGLSAGAMSGTGRVRAQDEARTQQFYLTARDGAGAIVTDLSAADIAVKAAGKPREVIRAELASTPMAISVIVDDNGTGIFRAGLAQFIQRLQGQARFALSSVTVQTHKIVDFTSNLQTLADGLNQMGVHGATPDGGQLLAGIDEAARELRKLEAPRPVIVVLTVGGEEQSPLAAHDVLEHLRASGAVLHVVSVAPGVLRSTMQVRAAKDLLEGPLNLNEVLGDGPKQSGGRREEIVGTAGLVLSLQSIAEDLSHQYLVAYALPPGAKPDQRITVSVSRPGLVIHAPTRLPDK